MAAPGRTSTLIVAALIIVVGIIHFGVGVGIVARYHKYSDVFRQTVGLSGFDIVVALYGIAVGIVSLISIIRASPSLGRTAAICSGFLGVIAIASLIAALAINATAIGYIRGRLLYRVNTYIDTQGSINVMDSIQTNYQCCGVNLWLDWGLAGLGVTTTIGTGTNSGTGTNTVIGRRRRHFPLPDSPLVKAVRQRRQLGSGSNLYNLPSSYTLNLPLSCCTNGGTSPSNVVGGYCQYTAGNSSTGFYVDGCLAPVANVAVTQITGIAVINVCMAILAIVLIPLLMRLFPAGFDPNNPNNKQPLPNQIQQEQQMQNGAYYANNINTNNPNQMQGQQQMQNGGYFVNYIDPNAYYSYPQPTYVVYP